MAIFVYMATQHICVCIYIYMYVCMCGCACINIYIYIYLCVGMCVSTHTHIYIYMDKLLAIITYPSQNTQLNKKSEILSKCRHKKKHFFHTSTHSHNPPNTSYMYLKKNLKHRKYPFSSSYYHIHHTIYPHARTILTFYEH